ncbi:MAG: ATP-dependent DNA helicase [Lachnospiraceae bacterium]|nr:ATP-dependent DNA helicase [Lachnospiraceae bacterium]
MEIQISVRNLVEFILRSGNIDNRRFTVVEVAMQEGGRIHRMIQRRMGSDYHAEVSVKYRYETDNYTIIIDGRIDGIIIPIGSIKSTGRNTAALLKEEKSETGELIKISESYTFSEENPITIDEIKGTYREVLRMKEPIPIHMAQAMCYAYIYATQNDLETIRVRMTYCNLITEDIKYFHQEYSYKELHAWFENLMSEYRKWADHEFVWREKRVQSIKNLSFPFPYRDGQKDLITYVYQTIYHRRKLYIEAPTGAGKTISTIFPAIKAMGEGLAEKIFYLTAKTITRTVAEEAFSHLRERGLNFKTVILTAKDKICFMEETECNPIYCPYAAGHYDRINEAVYALLTESDSFTREKITEYAETYQVCPFELGLDMSLFSDGIIGDYNYLFDPQASLKRFFAERSQREYIFLIDEAHNLVDRGREMYSALLRKEDFLALKKVIKDYAPNITKLLERSNREMLAVKRETEKYQVEPYIEPFTQSLSRLSAAMEKYLEDNENSPIKKDMLMFYFEVLHFLDIKEKLDDNYVVYALIEDDLSFMVKLFCVNPTNNLREYMQRGRASILFSATLLPIGYYRKLLGADAEDYDVYAQSVFDPNKRGLFIACDVTSKYTRRNETEYYNIARYLYEITKNRHGNYLTFFPSHQFLRKVYECYIEFFHDGAIVDLILQEEYMDEEKREDFLKRFSGYEVQAVPVIEGRTALSKEAEGISHSLIGFCVSGGIFSEGIDLKNDNLIGAIIIGTSLPQVCPEREIIKRYFDEQGENGFDYAYKLPGINKVLQSAGRVIRTQDDIGIVVLLDERFIESRYRKLFPHEWRNIEIVKIDQVAGRVEKFWNDWL